MYLTDNQKVALYGSALQGVLANAEYLKAGSTHEATVLAISIADEMIQRLAVRSEADPHAPVTD